MSKPNSKKAPRLKGKAAGLKRQADEALKKHNYDIATFYYQQLLAEQPDLVEALSGMGYAYQQQGKNEQAAQCYQKALKIDPRPELQNQIGHLLLNLGYAKQAKVYFKQAWEQEKDNILYLQNMGAAAHQMNETAEAFDIYCRVLEMRPTHSAALMILPALAKKLQITILTPSIKNAVLICLQSDQVAHDQFLALWSRSLIRDKDIEAIIRGKGPYSLDQDKNYETVLEKLTQPYVTCGLRVMLNKNLNLESILVKLRKHYLINLNAIDVQDHHITFFSALAEHCFLNEYILYVSDDEEKILSGLSDLIVKEIEAGRAPFLAAALYACYAPLYRNQNLVTGLKSLEDRMPEDFFKAYKLQVLEPLRESELAKEMPVLVDIHDDVSQKVRAQYEENPYPRWRYVTTRHDNKNQYLQTHPFNILVAGSGTGKQPINTHFVYKASDIDAVDLSLASLSYAKRKAEELNVSKINFMQGDILKLGILDKPYDLIMCSGVLHHMHNPEAGLEVLIDLLAENGEMSIGLYSEIARTSVVAAREEIAQLNLGTDAASIRNYRYQILNESSAEKATYKLKWWNDFYSLSMFRDLVFHVQEHRYTFPKLKNMFDRYDLAFRGFSYLSGGVLDAFKAMYPQEEDYYDLDKWHAFEVQNPDSFAAMYQVWVCRKKELEAIRSNPQKIIVTR